MKTSFLAVGTLLTLYVHAAPLPPPKPILTEAEVRAAAADVTVAKIDFLVPEKESAAEDTLSGRFFNQPAEHRYSGLTNANWEAKWQLFSDALVAAARQQKLDAPSLEACLKALNRGRNRQTMLWPFKENAVFGEDTSPAEIAAFEKQAEEKYQRALQEREKSPERWYNNSLAIVPVGAYLARHPQGECWIVVCKWEMISQSDPYPLGHIMVWALDAKTARVVGYVTCD